MKTINFMGARKLWFGISLTLLAVGLIFLIINGGLNLGMDFVGGSSIHATIGKAFEVSEIRDIMDKYDPNATITYAGQNRDQVIVRTKISFDNEKRAEIVKAFTEKYSLESNNISFETIGPTVGKELAKQSLIALLLAFVGIMVYVSFRFEWRFGLASIAALIHDVAIMVAAYAILQIPVNGTFIAALLTIIGYSINATIVIFDKIRENIKSERGRKIDYDNLVNVSVTQTLNRSINTSLTTLITIFALYFLGVPAIKDIAFPMIVGIISGCYSSVLIASPLWVVLRRRFKVSGAR
ncbi:MAG: protein translocase subunit SecF [Gracilibacteraceae bacterium]|jgi:preprotein translocase subunit SecF|nr:protein translocase subunit SecF [Gracilibacteraceae bacterium]